MPKLEFVIPIRPLSLQAANRPNFQKYKAYVGHVARVAWGKPPIADGVVNVSIVFHCDERAPIDVDNIIKPIQDAMNGIVYIDDVMVTDCDSHRRFLQEPLDVTDLPPKLIRMLAGDAEAVYVRVRSSGELGEHL